MPEVGAVSGDKLLFARKSPLLRVETTGPRTTVLGKEAAYTVRIQNLGDVAAEGVAVQIRLPEWTEVTVTQPSRGTAHRTEVAAGGSPLLWQLDRIEGRGNEELLLKLVPRKSQRFDLGVAWSFTPAVSQAEIEVQEPKLEVAISGPRDVLFGESKIYHLTVTNPGTGDAEQVTLQLMPIDGGSQPNVSQSLGTLQAGRSKSLAIELTAHQAGMIRITTLVSADGGLRAEAAEEVKALAGRVESRGDRSVHQIRGHSGELSRPHAAIPAMRRPKRYPSRRCFRPGPNMPRPPAAATSRATAPK